MRRPNRSMFILVFFGLFSTVGLLASVSTHTSAAYSHSAAYTPTAYVYLPIVARQPTPTPAPPKELCSPNAQEREIANRMKADPDQQRLALICHPILEQVARARAQDMGVRAYFGHVNPDGFGPNHLVQQAGYLLPSWYDQSPSANNIESIAAGYSTTDSVWQGWMNSSGHRTHILGLHPFYAEQTDYGIGYADVPGSPFRHYWVVITAKRGP